MLLEKAFAKYTGSYHGLDGGFTSYARTHARTHARMHAHTRTRTRTRTHRYAWLTMTGCEEQLIWKKKAQPRSLKPAALPWAQRLDRQCAWPLALHRTAARYTRLPQGRADALWAHGTQPPRRAGGRPVMGTAASRSHEPVQDANGLPALPDDQGKDRASARRHCVLEVPSRLR